MEADISIVREKRIGAFRGCCARYAERIEISEWLLSLTMAVVGLHMLLFPTSIQSSHMQMIISTVPLSVIAFFCLCLGTSRLALVARRNVSPSAMRVRAVLSIASSIVWLEMAFAFSSRFVDEVPPPGLEMLTIVQVVGDMWVAWRIKTNMADLRAKGIFR